MSQSGRNLIKNLVGEEKALEAKRYYLERYKEHSRFLCLKEGARDLLKFAVNNGFFCVLASNKSGTILRAELERLNLTSFFDYVIGAEDAKEDKPSKVFTDKAIDWILEKNKTASIDEIISVGDGLADVMMAKNYENGTSILVFSSPDEKEFEKNKPTYYAASLKKCRKILSAISRRKIQVDRSCVRS